MQTLMAEVLEAWRRAERLAGDLPQDSPERAAAQAACESLRDLYHQLTTAVTAGQPDIEWHRGQLDELSPKPAT